MLLKCKYFVLIFIFMKSFFDCHCTKDIFENSFVISIVYSTGPSLHNRTIEIDKYFEESKVDIEQGKLWEYNIVKTWISAFDWLDDNLLILADSKQKILITGEFKNNKLFNIKPLNISGNQDFGYLIRSLTVYRKNKLIYLSLPTLKRIDQINLINGKKKIFVDNVDPGHITLDSEGNLVWIHRSCSIWIYKEKRTQQLIPCSNEIINVISIVDHGKSYYLYWFSANGSVRRSDINGNNRQLVASNVFEDEKYLNAEFYSIHYISSSNEVIFYTSDSKHHMMRLTYVTQNSNGNEFFSRTKSLFVENNMYDFSLVISLHSHNKIESEWIHSLRSLAKQNRLNSTNYKIINLSSTNSALYSQRDYYVSQVEFSQTNRDNIHQNLTFKSNIETYLPISLYALVIVALIVALIWLITSLVISKQRYHRITEVKRF